MNVVKPSTATLLVFLLLFASFYRRFRRMVGRQRLSHVRLWIRLIIYPVIFCLLGALMYQHPERLVWIAGPMGLGLLLGVFGLKKTDFESTPDGLFYTPHAPLGVALSLLLVVRVAYRLLEIYASPPHVHTTEDFGKNPLTLIVFGLLAGYNIAYAIGLLRWRSRTLRAGQPGEPREMGRGEASV